MIRVTDQEIRQRPHPVHTQDPFFRTRVKHPENLFSVCIHINIIRMNQNAILIQKIFPQSAQNNMGCNQQGSDLFVIHFHAVIALGQRLLIADVVAIRTDPVAELLFDRYHPLNLIVQYHFVLIIILIRASIRQQHLYSIHFPFVLRIYHFLSPPFFASAILCFIILHVRIVPTASRYVSDTVFSS